MDMDMVMLVVISLLVIICLSILIWLIIGVRLFLHRTALIYVVRRWIEWVDDRLHPHQHFKVPEFLYDSSVPHQKNQFYSRVSQYVNSLASLEDSDFTNLFSSSKNPNDIVLSPDHDQVIRDIFLGARVSWVHKNNGEGKSLVLRIKTNDKRRILKPYLQHINTVLVVSPNHEYNKELLRIYNNNCHGVWKSVVPFHHPATFDTLVIDPDLKTKIRYELDTFLKSKQYYNNKLGRVWKRSYLLYGPSGTGKSSFIAAVANYLKYDVYNVNLSHVVDDADLLLQTSNKSLIVVEDLDLYLVSSSKQRIGLMNFMDGLLNFQDERIMIFTMNNKDGIDSALLRPGRIDVHIYFPMCDFNSFKSLATNYLGVKEHKLFPQVEEIFQSGASMSPAEISELMLVNRSSPSRALKSVIMALQSTKVVHPRLISDSVTSSPSMAAWKETTIMPKEFRKLYGLLRFKSCRKPPAGSFHHDSQFNDISNAHKLIN